jgi:hypothetical protein
LQASPQLWTSEYDMSNSYMSRWSLQIEREFGSSWMASAAYTGSRGVHLWVQMEPNVNKWCTPNAAGTACAAGQPAWPDSNIKPKFWPQISGVNRINPALGASVRIFYPMANSFYHGLALAAQKRLSYGLLLQATYNFSKTIDDGAGIVQGDSLPELQRSNQPWDFYLHRALSSQHIKNSLVLNFTYDFPRAPYSGVLDRIVNGWRMNGIWSATSGFPRSVTDTRTAQVRDRIGVSTGGRASLAPGGDSNPTSGTTAGCAGVRNQSALAVAGTKLGGPDLYFDPCQFVPTTPGFYGNLGRNTVIGPGFNVFDWSLFKDFAVVEGHRVQFRAEFFNALNRSNFQPPSMGPWAGNGTASTTVGQITSTRDQGRSRQIQFALKYIF